MIVFMAAVEQRSENKHGEYVKVHTLDPADGLLQRFNLPGNYPIGTKLVISVEVNVEQPKPMNAMLEPD